MDEFSMDRFGQFRRAAQGDPEAMKTVARLALPSYRAKYRGLDEEVERHRREIWDVEGMRAWALDPETEVTAEEFEAALGELRKSVLTITAATAPLLAGNERESRRFEEVLREGALELFLQVNNPVIRYTIVAGFEPQFREDVDDSLLWLGRELWGTAGALVQDELDVENYPPDTAKVLQEVAELVMAGKSDGDNVGGN